MIESVKLVIQGKEVDLTLSELQELQQDIEKIFPKPQYYPAPYPIYPTPVFPSYPVYPNTIPTVWYGNGFDQTITELTTTCDELTTTFEWPSTTGSSN